MILNDLRTAERERGFLVISEDWGRMALGVRFWILEEF
jgi:hypothetical protein